MAIIKRTSSYRVMKETMHCPGGGQRTRHELDDFDFSHGGMSRPVDVDDFRRTWEATTDAFDVTEEFRLEKHKSIQDTVKAVVDALGMTVCDKSDQVSAAARAHRLLLAGLLLGPTAAGPPVHTMVRADLRMSATQGVDMKIFIRSEAQETAAAVLETISA
eukprot:CAMPEP_0172196260 /NCGR_PEP_ID=MMETSP1050-20130122/26713_1 /TAXON_ID=233186 /ORGANISM="Cryptomonas curvata, Strain CCAP979/52" /LENGTH=160 /DNA_ID=CAMNT_0012872511 /DNA_START=1609 /DNA_END=2091 /DNA_ORIENTATION=-